MIIAMIILGIVIIGLIILINYIRQRSESEFNSIFNIGFNFGIWLIILCIIEINIVSGIIAEPRPTAMDVYSGKTTIEYTVKDGIKVDSVVVFKESYGKD